MKPLDQQSLEALAAQLGQLLAANGQYLVTAESCSGGWVAQCVTAIAGSSAWFDRGFVTYSNEAKSELLGVDAELLNRHGAVSEACAMAMADGALRRSRADWALSISGIAGPDGGLPDKPVGTVCFAWVGRGGEREVQTCRFDGDRAAVRACAVEYALRGVMRKATVLCA